MTFEAALGAGADAVYVGGPEFGARAYAHNFTQDELLQAIDTVHIHGKKLYLTVNTLLKNRELQDELYDALRPLYENGLDAVIIQISVYSSSYTRIFRDCIFMQVHQMTVTGPEGMKFLEEQGASRVVAARELSPSGAVSHASGKSDRNRDLYPWCPLLQFFWSMSHEQHTRNDGGVVEDVHNLVAFPIRFGRRMAVIHSDNRISVHSV